MNGPLRHRGPVTSTAALPNRRSVVTGAYDGAVATFDLDTGAFRALGYHSHLVNRVVVDTAGDRAASCSSDYTVHLWDIASHRRTAILRGHADDVEDFVFVDEHTGVSASRDRRILVWNLATGAIRCVLDSHDKDVLSLACHGGHLYSSGDDKTLRVWDIAEGRLLRTFGPFELETDTCAIDPLHGRVVLGCDDGVIRVFDVRSGESVGDVPAHSSGIKKVAVSKDGHVLSAAYDQRIVLWNGDTLDKRLELENVPHKWERSFSFSPDGDRIFAGTFDGTVVEWDAATGKRLREIGADGAGNACFNRVAASPRGGAVTVSDDGLIRLAQFTPESAAWGESVCPDSGRMLMNAVAVDAHGEFVAAGAHDQKLHLYGRRNGRLENHREVHLGEGPINFISIASHRGAKDHCFVACYSGRVVRVAPNGEVLARLPVHDGAVKSVRLHPTRELGVSCSADNTLRAWDFEGRLVERYLGHMAIINDVDISPSGNRIASVSRDFTLKVYEIDSARLIESFQLGRRSLKSVCFASEDTVLVGDYWGTLLRVNLKSGQVCREQVATNGLSSLARCGSLVLATSYDGSVSAVHSLKPGVAHRIEAMKQRVSS